MDQDGKSTNKPNEDKEENNKSKHPEQIDTEVQEIIDICQSYNEHCKNSQTSIGKPPFSLKSCNNRAKKTTEKENDMLHIINGLNDQLIREVSTSTPRNLFDNLSRCNSHGGEGQDSESSNDIRKMQAKQSSLQKELDSILKDQECLDNNEEDQELAEFQRLENEVRIAELNKELDTIQEEIRLKLYNQLFSQNSSDSSSNEALSSSSDGGFELNNKHSSASESEASINQSNLSTGVESPYRADCIYSRQKTIGSPRSNYDSLEPVDEEEMQSISNSERDKSKVANNEKRADSSTPSTYDLTPTISKESINSFSRQQSVDNDDGVTLSSHTLESITAQYYLDKIINHPRFSTAVRDLARIDEGEEELPEMNPHKASLLQEINDDVTDSLAYSSISPSKPTCNTSDAKSQSNTSANSKQNRPLTLYLPKPNEDLDLLDHVQIMGHDMNIISGDIQISSSRAYGLLWKSCMRSPKKWKKRFFLFDRQNKVISYYQNERDLVKNGCNPNNIIRFDKIIDVYVDHKLSGARAKIRSRNRNYFFVLATKDRNYILASAKAETMRVWIDIMFTAAQSYEYF